MSFFAIVLVAATNQYDCFFSTEDTIGIHMLVPLPILHPAYISVIVYTRETDNPFSSDNPVSQAIIKALQVTICPIIKHFA